MRAPASHIKKMHEVWVSSWDEVVSRPNSQVLDPNVYTVVPAEAPDTTIGGPSGLSAPSALGLPLSRALAKAAYGWLGLEDSRVSFSVKVVGGNTDSGRVHAYSPAAVVAPAGPGMLWLWCVLHVDAVGVRQ